MIATFNALLGSAAGGVADPSVALLPLLVLVIVRVLMVVDCRLMDCLDMDLDLDLHRDRARFCFIRLFV